MDVGRPSKFKPEYCQMLVNHMAEGYSFESFAALIDVSRETLYEWGRVHPEFSDSKKTAFDKNLLFWERAGITGMRSPKEFCATTWIFNMKNRHKWRDKQEVEVSGESLIRLAYDASRPIEKPQSKKIEDKANGKKTLN